MAHEKKYENGIIVGRFQGFHNGHAWMIYRALQECHKVWVFIGSAEKMGEYNNPFSYREREDDILEWYRNMYVYDLGDLEIRPLVDINVGDGPEWGRYVMNNAQAIIGSKPDAFYSGVEQCRANWFPDTEEEMDIIELNRGIFNYSATDVRHAACWGEYDKWCTMVPSTLWHKWEDVQHTYGMMGPEYET